MMQIEISYKILKILKAAIINIFTYYTTKKIMNINIKWTNLIIEILINILIALIYYILKIEVGLILAMIILIILLGIIIGKSTRNNVIFSIVCTTIALAINNIIFSMASAIIYFPSRILNLKNSYIISIVIDLLYLIMVYGLFRVKRLKNGLNFLKATNNEYFEILFLNISISVLLLLVLITNYNINVVDKIGTSLVIFSIIMFITIQKSIQLYYKQKLLVQELKETKEKLEEKTKEIKELEEENIKISKKSHTLVHKQKSLEHKIEGLIGKTEISKEEVGELTNRIKEINKELYKEKTVIELDKTEISQIDDMLKYMQSECKKNNIDFELQIKGNIHHMINNLISKEDLETLLADHIKNAIIAINHGNNINRSILVRIGKIDECYGLYIYDSGIEFEKETLQNLGKKPSTTHVNEGGTGMGFMNTFDTLKKCNASLIIEEYNEPSKDNYTKVIKIKFNNKNEFEIKTYR